jgi:hypothetical protein
VIGASIFPAFDVITPKAFPAVNGGYLPAFHAGKPVGEVLQKRVLSPIFDELQVLEFIHRANGWRLSRDGAARETERRLSIILQFRFVRCGQKINRERRLGLFLFQIFDG